MLEQLKKTFPLCADRLPCRFWDEMRTSANLSEAIAGFPGQVAEFVERPGCAGCLPDLARVELARERLRNRRHDAASAEEELQINPSLELLEVAWSPLLPLLDGELVEPQPASQLLAFWRHPRSGRQRWALATAEELLALKMVAEQLDPQQVAATTGRPVGVIDAILEKGVNMGLLLSPPSRLMRDDGFPVPENTPGKFLQAEVFTLQWHITQRCNLHCRHCYDRSECADVDLARGLETLDQLRAFCLRHQVGGHVTFTGGNPFMHPDFFDLYQAARDRNLSLAILGNPVTEGELDALLQIARPAFFQVSLEGLEEHNDSIRGRGNFSAILDFLDLLRSKGVYSMVMLTLTRGTLDQVLPLAERLRDRVDLFT